MVEFLTQYVAIPMWGTIVLGLFALLGVFFFPIALIAMSSRRQFTQKGLDEMNVKLDKIAVEQHDNQRTLEGIREERRLLETEKIAHEQATKDFHEAQTKLNEESTKNEAAKKALEDERKEIERANKCRNGLLEALKAQKQSIEQAKMELVYKAQNKAQKEAIIKSTLKK